MDMKARHKSHYMKKYSEEQKRMRKDYMGLERAAGTMNYNPLSDKLQGQKYLNPSRRKILNDFVSIGTETNPDEIVNNNKSNQLKMLVLKNSNTTKH